MGPGGGDSNDEVSVGGTHATVVAFLGWVSGTKELGKLFCETDLFLCYTAGTVVLRHPLQAHGGGGADDLQMKLGE